MNKECKDPDRAENHKGSTDTRKTGRSIKELTKHAGHTHGIECAECELEIKRTAEPRSWYRQPRVILLSTSGILTLVAFGLEGLSFSQLLVKTIFFLSIIIGGYYPAILGLRAIRTLTLNINTLLITAAVGAMLLDLWGEAAVLVFVFSLGSVLETYAVDKARDSIGALIDLVPRYAQVLRHDKEETTDVDDVKIGEIVRIKPSEKIPLDGIVVSGSSSVDQSPITGESIPVFKQAQDPIYAGAINLRGSLEIQVTRKANDTTLAQIIHLVEEHQARKSNYQRFGERFGRYYTPTMFGLALIVAVVPPVLVGDWASWFLRALVVLVVSCSCGIALSVPVAVVSAISNAARNGVLIKGGTYLEIGSKVNALVFDKTGTVTTGKPVVTDIRSADDYTREKLLSLAASIESSSEHPLAHAIVEQARSEDVSYTKPDDFHSIPGLGARGTLDGNTYHIGSERLLEAHSISLDSFNKTADDLETQGKTIVFISKNDTLIGLIAVSDQLRDGVSETIKQLKKMNIEKIDMLTGDNKKTAKIMAQTAGFDDFQASLLPEDKVSAVLDLEKKHGVTAMIGDGVNDAPAMAASSLGIAMGAAGTDVAIQTSDIALMSDDLSKLPYFFALSRRTVKIIVFNIFVALTIVAFLVPLALLGYIGLVPGLLINEFGALLVIINGLRLLKTKT